MRNGKIVRGYVNPQQLSLIPSDELGTVKFNRSRPNVWDGISALPDNVSLDYVFGKKDIVGRVMDTRSKVTMH